MCTVCACDTSVWVGGMWYMWGCGMCACVACVWCVCMYCISRCLCVHACMWCLCMHMHHVYSMHVCGMCACSVYCWGACAVCMWCVCCVCTWENRITLSLSSACVPGPMLVALLFQKLLLNCLAQLQVGRYKSSRDIHCCPPASWIRHYLHWRKPFGDKVLAQGSTPSEWWAQDSDLGLLIN